MRLIDADAAYKVLADYYHHRMETQYKALKEALSKVPTIDAEPVVRCKDCDHWVWPNTCGLEVITSYEDDFCSKAEKKEVKQCIDRES